jgi:diguanylate cyclase (GGDEF)-like protein
MRCFVLSAGPGGGARRRARGGVVEPNLTVEALLERFVDVFRMHIFSGEIRDGEYWETFTGPGLDALLGGVCPSGVDAAAEWRRHVHADDLARYVAAMQRSCHGEPADVEYRLVGFDGLERWVRECSRPRRVRQRLFIDGFAVDITAIREARADADAAQEHLDRIVGSVDEHLYTAQIDRYGGYQELYTGPGTERFLGPIPPGADPVAAWDERVHPDDRDAVCQAYAARSRGVSNEVVYRLLGFDGKTRWVSERGVVRSATTDGFVVDGIVTNITIYKETELRLREALTDLGKARADAERRSRTDQLTGLGNRVHLSELLDHETRRAETPGPLTGLVLLDLDDFKRVNDTFGHIAGDAVLVEVARRITSGVRPSDSVARWGGEEFAVLAVGLRDSDELLELAERLRRLISTEPFLIGSVDHVMTVSVGATMLSVKSDAVQALREADDALYTVKREGRNHVRIARPPAA